MNIKLALQWYVPDNWYGSNKRVALVPAKDEFFTSKTQAKQYLSALKKYVKENYKIQKPFTPQILCEDKDASCFETYRYCGAGPSWSCSEHLIELKDITKYLLK